MLPEVTTSWTSRPRPMFLSTVFCLCLLSPPTRADTGIQDKTSLEGVGLFEHACLPFAGLAGNLRMWIAGKGLHPVSDAMAASVLRGHAGKIYNASTLDAKLVLISFDDGACVVVMPSGDKDAVDKTLHAVFRTLGAVVTQVADKTSPDNKSQQTLDLVTLGKHSWHVSVTSHVHGDNMLARPNVLIMATMTP